MNERDLNALFDDTGLADARLQEFLAQRILFRQRPDPAEIRGHFLKAEHNLRFVQASIPLGFPDWAITGCYYACYHAAISLILTKGYSSKNHLATLCVLIKEYYRKDLNKEDIETLSRFLDYQDILFYVESKQKREGATYSTATTFTKADVEQLKLKVSLFVAKVRSILGQ